MFDKINELKREDVEDHLKKNILNIFKPKVEEYDGAEEAVENIKYWKNFNLPEG